MEDWCVARAVCEAVASSARLALPQNGGPPPLSCPQCRWLPSPPVTLPCGHTLCRPCLAAACPLCQAPLPRPSVLRDNVVAKAALSKWMAPEAASTKLRETALLALRHQDLSSFMTKLQAAIDTCPHDHLSYEARSEALFRLGDFEGALKDAEAVVRLRPLWPKGYLRRGAAQLALGAWQEALVSYLVHVAITKQCADSVSNDIAKIIYEIINLSGGKSGQFKPSELFQLWFDHRQTKMYGVSPDYANLHLAIEKAFIEIDKLKRVELEPGELWLRAENVEAIDFECVLCCRTLWRPVTTPCGHTYCSMCLDRCLDYSANCPLCMTSLADYLCTSERHTTPLLEYALVSALPQEYAMRLLSYQQEQTALLHTTDLSVFVCTTAYPGMPCPLYVFEPRYRLLVRRAVASGQRRFAMVASLPGPNFRYAEFGTVLEIKDWVLLNDGCSILSNVGTRRFRVISKGERDGYDTAQVQYLIDEPIPPTRQREVIKIHDMVRERGRHWFSRLCVDTQREIVTVFGPMPQLEANWTTLADGPAWMWWLVAILPLAPHLQVGIIGTTNIEKRLRAIEKTLNHVEYGQGLMRGMVQPAQDQPQTVSPIT